MPYDVFISYSRDDCFENGRIIPGNAITRIKDALNNSDFTYWFDEEEGGVNGGDEYMIKIAEAIEDSLILVFVSSKNSNKSEWTPGEIGTANIYRKKIIPFRIDDTPYNKAFIVKIAP